MNDLVDRALALWDDDTANRESALVRFREVYADPVRVNGALVTVEEMVGRAFALRAAFAGRRTVVHDIVDGDGFIAFAFEIHARHAGPWPGAAGVVEATGRQVVVQGMDIFRFDGDGRVATIWAVNDVGDALARST